MTYWPIDPTILLPVARALPRRLLVTPMEDGPPKTRLRNEGAPGALSGSILLTGADFQTFLAWGEGALLSWSQPFQWRDPLDAAVRTMQFAGEPSGLTLEASGDAGDPSKSTWRLSVSLWVIDG